MELDARRVAAIAAGGMTGAALRWALTTVLHAGRFDWPVLLINVAGSLALGGLLAAERARPSARRGLILRDAGGIGFCGGLTTFSTFSVDVAELLRDGHGATATAYAVVSVAGALAGLVLGAATLRRVRA